MKRWLEFTDDEFEALDPKAQEAVLSLERHQRANLIEESGHQDKSTFSAKRFRTEEQFMEKVSSLTGRDGRTMAPDLHHRDSDVPWRKKQD